MTRRTLLLVPLAVCLTGVRARSDDAGLRIYFNDVMGGAATLIVTPEKESILIDSGWPGFEGRDPKRIVHALKDLAGCDHIDHLITTHWHRDHFGGVEGLAQLVEIKQFWDRGLPEDNIAGQDFPNGPKADDPLGIAYRKASRGKRQVLKAGDEVPLKGGTKLVVLAASGKVVPPPPNATPNPLCSDTPADLPEDPSDNARSLVMKLSYGKFDFFVAGDLTWNIEKQLVCPIDLIGPIDLYQVTHHGADNSNHPTLVKTIAPTVAIMNNGPRKGGTAPVVKLLRSAPSIQAFYAGHKNQATGPEANAEPALTANRGLEGGELIQVRVEPGGATFSVGIGEQGPARSFEAR